MRRTRGFGAGQATPPVNLMELRDQLQFLVMNFQNPLTCIYDISHYYRRIALPEWMRPYFAMHFKSGEVFSARSSWVGVTAAC